MSHFLITFLEIKAAAQRLPECLDSPYGCCWDLTAALGPGGEGCRGEYGLRTSVKPLWDPYRASGLTRYLTLFSHSRPTSAIVPLHMTHVTTLLCISSAAVCRNLYTRICRLWNGYCQPNAYKFVKESVVHRYRNSCPVTCGKCKIGQKKLDISSLRK